MQVSKIIDVFSYKGVVINILYEDNHLLVVEKPINIPTQEDSSGDIDLLSALKEYVKTKYKKPGNVYLGLIHRIDRPVGGVMVFAKTSKSASRLSEQIKNKEFIRNYHAVIKGNLKEEGTWVDYLLKNKKTNTTVVSENGKRSVLSYRIIKTHNDLTLVSVNLETGRPHQIRVQFSSRGWPLYGDQRYNKESRVGEQIALFASKVKFIHPITKDIMEFELELPKRSPFKLFN